MRTGSLEYQELECVLRLWGAWWEQHYLDDSLPRQSSHTVIYSDHAMVGHRILCAEMQKAVWRLNYVILKLEHKHQCTLLAWYAANVKPTGGYWEAKEKAKELGLRLNVFRMRVTRARRALHRKIYLTSGDKSQQNMSACKVVTSRITPKIEDQPWSIEPLVGRTVPA